MDDQTQQLVQECKRQEESCLYTSTTFYEWLKALRFWRAVFVITPIVAGAFASWQLIADDQDWKWFTALCALVAGVLPAVYKALDLDVSMDALRKSAHEFKVLQDRFRKAARVSSLGDFPTFDSEVSDLLNRLDDIRSASLTPPDRFFKKAQQKIASGDYDFGIDQKPGATRSSRPVE
jgi:hypothetical protein